MVGLANVLLDLFFKAYSSCQFKIDFITICKVEALLHVYVVVDCFNV